MSRNNILNEHTKLLPKCLSITSIIGENTTNKKFVFNV